MNTSPAPFDPLRPITSSRQVMIGDVLHTLEVDVMPDGSTDIRTSSNDPDDDNENTCINLHPLLVLVLKGIL